MAPGCAPVCRDAHLSDLQVPAAWRSQRLRARHVHTWSTAPLASSDRVVTPQVLAHTLLVGGRVVQLQQLQHHLPRVQEVGERVHHGARQVEGRHDLRRHKQQARAAANASIASHTHAQGGCPVTDTLTCHKLLVPLAQKRPGHLHPPDPPALQPAVASLILPCLPPNNA